MNQNTLFILRFAGLLWLVKLVEIFLGISFAGFGIFPRSLYGQQGILLAPHHHCELNNLHSKTRLYLVLCPVMCWINRGAPDSAFSPGRYPACS